MSVVTAGKSGVWMAAAAAAVLVGFGASENQSFAQRRVVVVPNPNRPAGPVVVVPGRPGEGRSGGGRGWERGPGRGYGRDGRVWIRDARAGDDLDRFANQWLVHHVSDLSCDGLGDLLRRVSNEILSVGEVRDDAPEDPRAYPGRRDEWLRRNRLRHLRNLLRRPQFGTVILERITDAFRSCARTCFDDGEAVGVISGTGFCTASVATGGLPGDGFRYQERLPVCQTANFVGCQQGFAQAVNTVAGCLTYTTGDFTRGYLNWVSQDCHIDAN